MAIIAPFAQANRSESEFASLSAEDFAFRLTTVVHAHSPASTIFPALSQSPPLWSVPKVLRSATGGVVSEPTLRRALANLSARLHPFFSVGQSILAPSDPSLASSASRRPVIALSLSTVANAVAAATAVPPPPLLLLLLPLPLPLPVCALPMIGRAHV